MDFKEYIESHREEIHSGIMRYLPVREPKEYYEMLRDYPNRQGKYVRPSLLLLCGEMFGAKISDIILPAAAMQLSEDWILMHDDVEDNSDTRRGKPALHKLYGAEQAINAGDAAHMAMWKMLCDYMKKKGLPKGSALFDKFYEVLSMTVEGQYMDIKFTQNIRRIGQASERMYYDIVSRKTSCYSIYGPMQLGAMAAGAGKETLGVLEEIGLHAGSAFQIIDDVLDMTANEKDFGKQKYGDLYEGKLTLIMLHAYDRAARAEKIKIDRIYKKERKDKTRDDIDFLAYVAEKYRSVDYAYGVAMKHGEKAQEALNKNMAMFPDNEFKGIFISAVSALFVRKK